MHHCNGTVSTNFHIYTNCCLIHIFMSACETFSNRVNTIQKTDWFFFAWTFLQFWQASSRLIFAPHDWHNEACTFADFVSLSRSRLRIHPYPGWIKAFFDLFYLIRVIDKFFWERTAGSESKVMVTFYPTPPRQAVFRHVILSALLSRSVLIGFRYESLVMHLPVWWSTV